MSCSKSKSKTRLSTYRETLSGVEKLRYDGKLSTIGDIDPYAIGAAEWSSDVALLPAVCYPDIVNYLIFNPSPYTLHDLKCFKSLEAYNQFVSGWVRDVVTVVRNDRHIVSAKVMHSQRMSEKPLNPWIVVEKNGKIICAHCNCMAGLGETCTHVAAVLFAVEATVKIRDSKTVTDEKAYWLLPTSLKRVQYKEVRNIDYCAITNPTVNDINI